MKLISDDADEMVRLRYKLQRLNVKLEKEKLKLLKARMKLRMIRRALFAKVIPPTQDVAKRATDLTQEEIDEIVHSESGQTHFNN